MALFDDWQWGDIAKAFASSIPTAVASVVGSNQVAKANTNAANIAQGNAATNRAVITGQTDKAVGMLKPQMEAAAPATDYLRTVMATSPYEMNPQQQVELADRRRQAVGMIPTGLRGSGRATTAVVNDVTNRGRAGMVSENLRRNDAAAGTLSSRGSTATNTAASLTSGVAPQIVAQNTGGNEAVANAGTATAESNNAALANISSFFANSMKDQDRDSRYGRSGFKIVPV